MSEIIEGKPQLPPGVCFICELSNPVRYIDTLRDFEGVVRERLDGRKYLCEECILDGAKKLGFAEPKAHAALKEDLMAAQAKVRELQADLQAYQDLDIVIKHFGGRRQVKVTVEKKAA